MQLLNEAIWQSVKGAGSTMPAPQHHAIDPAAYTGEGRSLSRRPRGAPRAFPGISLFARSSRAAMIGWLRAMISVVVNRRNLRERADAAAVSISVWSSAS